MYYRFRILATGEIAFVEADSWDAAEERLMHYFDSPDEFSVFGPVSEDVVFAEGADVY